MQVNRYWCQLSHNCSPLATFSAGQKFTISNSLDGSATCFMLVGTIRSCKNEFCFVLNLSVSAKKGSSSQPESSGDKGEGSEEQKKEGLNGEVEVEESNEETKEGEGAACGSKLRACRRRGGGEGSGSGTEMFSQSIAEILELQIQF